MDTQKDQKIMITGVHLTPALAVLEELQQRGYKNIIWVGRKQPYVLGTKEESLEYKTIKDKGIPFINLITGKLQRSLDLTFFLWGIRIPIGFIQSFFVILKHRPKIIITFGSYIGVPISFWGWIFRIKIILHEQPLVPGLAGKIISKFATKVCLSWNTISNKDKKYIYTGNPIYNGIYKNNTDEFKFSEQRKHTLLFVGGKAGSHILNVAVMGAVKKLSEKYNIIHQTGASPIADDLGTALDIAERINKNGIKYIPLRHYSGGEAYSKATIVIARSGANTVYELAALGKISIFIPIPFTRGDEQTKNAQLLESAGTAKILHQNILTVDTLISSIENVAENYDLMMSNIPKAKRLVTLDAQKRIADIVEKTLLPKKIIKKKENISLQNIDTTKGQKLKSQHLLSLSNLIEIRKSLKIKLKKKKVEEQELKTEKKEEIAEVLNKIAEKKISIKEPLKQKKKNRQNKKKKHKVK